MNHEQLAHDYRSSMQRAAFAYLQRHEAQYLVDSDLLYDNCVRHMTTALEVPVFMAEQLAHNAWTELHVINQRKWIAVDWGTSPSSTVVYLIDTPALPHPGADAPADTARPARLRAQAPPSVTSF